MWRASNDAPIVLLMMVAFCFNYVLWKMNENSVEATFLYLYKCSKINNIQSSLKKRKLNLINNTMNRKYFFSTCRKIVSKYTEYYNKRSE